MATAPLESSTGTTLNESPSSHDERMEDLNPQVTRKRPRLDSGSAAHESVSDRASPVRVGAKSTTANPTSAEQRAAPSSGRSASKVTINMKSPEDTAMVTEVEDLPELATAPPLESSGDAAVPSANAISISSSPAQSPEIEVAEVEDMDQAPGTSQWKSLEEAIRDRAAPTIVRLDAMPPLTDKFPRLRGNPDLRENLEEIASILDKGHAQDHAVLMALTNWLQEVTENLDQLDYEVFAEDHEFWEELPGVVEGLLRRSQDMQSPDDEDLWACLETFFISYARLAVHFIRLDTFTLTQLAKEPDISAPELMSKTYLSCLGWILQIRDIPFFRTMESIHGNALTSLVTRVNDQVATPPIDAVKYITAYATSIVDLLLRWPQLSQTLIPVMIIAHNLVDSGMERKKCRVDEILIESAALARTLREMYRLCRSIDEKYQSHISKKSPWITSETSEAMMRNLSYMYFSLAHQNSDLAKRISSELPIQFPDGTNPEEYPTVIHWGWKFGVLKKQITDGRMELRVHGMETMQNDLVSIWRQYIQGNSNGPQHPVVRYLLNFLRENKIVEYIVGVDSHPQLVSRSGNIVGFLVVTSTYTNLDTDVLWRAVTESQDSRTVSEVLGMLTRTFPMHQPPSPALLYLCSKLLELPLNRFDARMIEFCEQLFQQIREKLTEQCRLEPLELLHIDAVPLRLCVRLIRESTANNEFAVEHKTLLQRFASSQLSHFIRTGLNESDRLEMYEICIHDIAEMNEFTVGSIQALNALLPVYDSQAIRKLATDFDLTRLIVLETAHTVESGKVDFSDSFSRNAFLSRIQTLNRIIDKVPDTISSELADTLWSKIFMSKKLFGQGKTAVWEMLGNVANRSTKRNPFIERCSQEYFDQILPEDFSPEILSFAKQSISYEIRFNPPPLAGENDIVSIPGMERIWKFILTAPPGSVETESTSYAIELYLDHALIRRSPKAAVEATHIGLVDRCVEQLKSAAATLKSFKGSTADGDDTSMAAAADTSEIRSEELRFSRSLLFLRQLLQGLRTRPQYSPPHNPTPSLPERPEQGEVIEISYQAFNGGTHSKVQTLRIGDLATGEELIERLVHLTGFTKFDVIYGGQKVDLLGSCSKTIRELKIRPGLMIVRKITDSKDFLSSGRRQSLTLVDNEVLKHFDDLYELLNIEEDQLACEIYEFLVVFPPQDRVRELVRSNDKSVQEIFPMERPYNFLYSVNALSTSLREETLEVSPNQQFVSHSIRMLVEAFTRPEMMESLADHPVKVSFACHLVECLLLAISATPSVPEDSSIVSNPAPVLQQLLKAIMIVRQSPSLQPPHASLKKLACSAFAVLLEASTRDSQFWAAVKEQARFEQLLNMLLLEEDNPQVRREIADTIIMACDPQRLGKKTGKGHHEDSSDLARAENPKRVDILATIWEAFVGTLPKTLDHPGQSKEYFQVALAIFRSVGEKSPEDLIFNEYLRQWSRIMLQHKSEEFVGREPVDHLILGFARLLLLCLELAGSANASLDTFDLAESLFNNLLFPDLSFSSNEPITPHIPVMHSITRQEVYKILVLLCERDRDYSKIAHVLEDIIPPDYTYALNWGFDRHKMIRSPVGYAGLKNLSNTCYLNSLLTQLFMNVGFREFMFQLNVTDAESTQKLLEETKKVFGHMQETWLRSVDPQSLVDAIRTYDNEPIDVSVQMDVDEFYNLLFDRWEGQILGAEEKKKFRTFYGGQLVQQIKSRECPHISERFEPFSAIQCEIKGKANLEESLQAYVEGEVMQGDNKYSCTSCGRHVDAVKRACLKEIPDNLIFHLKRFDFDMVTMMRSKINDEFQFPQRIDMRPFKVDYLSDPNSDVPEDTFELVGVLVHSGNAESGHYYSYIRERPSPDDASWVEFNDSEVSRFDPSKLADQCFGGLNDPLQPGQVRFSKVWNAYMLFYQRVSSMKKARSIYPQFNNNVPLRVPLPVPLGNHIAMENELFIRTYCLLDPYHAFLVRCLLTRSGNLLESEDPEKSGLGKSVVIIALDTLEQLVSRVRDLLELEPIVNELMRLANEHVKAALRILNWANRKRDAIRNLLLKSPHPIVRNSFVQLLGCSLAKLQNARLDAKLDDSERKKRGIQFANAFEAMVGNLEELWTMLPTANRSWDDYFELLVLLANLGNEEVETLLDNEFLLKCLEIIWIDGDDTKRLRMQYSLYYRMLEKGRKFSYTKLLELLAVLLRCVDITLSPTPDRDSRILRNGKFSLSETEMSFIRALGKNKELVFLRKILQQPHYNPPACRDIFTTLLNAEPELGLMEPICKVLEEGLRLAPAAHCHPFLEAALMFCSRSPDEERIVHLIDFVAKGVDSIDNSGGKEHLAFFTSALSIHNDRIDKNVSSHVIARIPDWAPTLLLYRDRIVRDMTFTSLRQILFNEQYRSGGEESHLAQATIAKELARACVDKLQKLYLTVPGQNVEARLVETVQIVISHCLDTFFGESEEDQEFVRQANAVIAAIEELSVDLPEELASDEWEVNSMLASDSEVGIAGSP